MPRILMSLPEITCAAPHGSRDRYGIVRVLCEDGREQCRHPAFDGVWVALNKRADA